MKLTEKNPLEFKLVPASNVLKFIDKAILVKA